MNYGAIAPDTQVRRAREGRRRRRCRIWPKEPSSAGLARNRSQRRVGVTGSLIRSLNAGRSRAAISIADDHASLLVHIYPDKVEQVAMWRRAAAEPDAAPLD